MYRAASLVVVLFSLLISVALAQSRGGARSPGSMPSASGLEVHITFVNGQPASGAQFRVELLNGAGVPVKVGFADDMGRVNFSGLAAGMYTLHITSPSTEEATSTFEISGFEHIHNQDVQVKLITPGTPAGSKQGSVSAQALHIPEKALKEFNKGNEAVQHKDFEAARAHYRKALEDYPQFAAAGNNLGSVCLQLRDYACARQALEQAVKSDDHSARALANLARLRMMEQHYPEAEALFSRSLAVEPANPEALMLMAETELSLHKFSDALWYARKVSAQNKQDFAVAHIIAGESLEAQHKPDEAVLEYQAFLKDAPQHPAAPQVQQALTRLNHAPTSQH
jgi:Tfp pilus assembly protein PilF